MNETGETNIVDKIKNMIGIEINSSGLNEFKYRLSYLDLLLAKKMNHAIIIERQ
jgi:hypothetical protein